MKYDVTIKENVLGRTSAGGFKLLRAGDQLYRIDTEPYKDFSGTDHYYVGSETFSENLAVPVWAVTIDA